MKMNMKWILVFSTACAAGVGGVILLFWATVGFGSMQLSGHGVVALTLGVLITTALAVALMALVFWSHRSERDDAVHDARIVPRQ
jgi:hypothetical protein